MIKFKIYCLTIILLISCQKDNLVNDKSQLIGKWKWLYTEHSFGWCEYQPEFNTINPVSDPNNYSVEFLEKGKVEFYKNGILLEKGRIVFEYFEIIDTDEFIYYFNVDGKPDQPMYGSGNKDTLNITYPYVESDPNCENYLNFFVRE